MMKKKQPPKKMEEKSITSENKEIPQSLLNLLSNGLKLKKIKLFFYYFCFSEKTLRE